MRKNFGPKTMCYPMNHHYLVLGEKAGQAFLDGLILKEAKVGTTQ